MEPRVKVTVFASFVTVPPQVVLAVLMPTNVTPIGSVSVNDAKVASPTLGLPNVMVSSELSPTLMLAPEKLLLSVGGRLAGVTTVNVASAGGAVP